MRIFISAVIIAVCGCTPSLQSGVAVDGVSLRAAPAATRDSIVLTLANGSAQSVGYNLCTSVIERRENDTWQNIPTDRVCTMELRRLQPGDETVFTTALPAGAAVGDYRFVTRVEIPLEGAQRAVTSNIVRVTT